MNPSPVYSRWLKIKAQNVNRQRLKTAAFGSRTCGRSDVSSPRKFFGPYLAANGRDLRRPVLNCWFKVCRLRGQPRLSTHVQSARHSPARERKVLAILPVTLECSLRSAVEALDNPGRLRSNPFVYGQGIAAVVLFARATDDVLAIPTHDPAHPDSRFVRASRTKLS